MMSQEKWQKVQELARLERYSLGDEGTKAFRLDYDENRIVHYIHAYPLKARAYELNPELRGQLIERLIQRLQEELTGK